ncbi:AfsR/SARP family transcriptional regulator [Mycobacterium sp. Aquia_213]|uniref:AfsR/SARP family transcriptional regulator n=1 Tax=Mycobacterium sp. Aquia_213 TaxID=2991728 RepID=UPI0022721B9B|nr:BTAD domain-containing putative transcriptional regulator [Mycobacterium sp. Aquia_213]WAC90181.1 BTAD domain-containing putative transcriptional regulator [Mycobacterium sp. Aquia_213]
MPIDDSEDFDPPYGLTARFFGGFDTQIDGQPVVRWRAGRSRNLFQYLLIHRGRLVTRDRLYEVLWPDAEWGSASSSLKVACHGLRSALGASRDDSGRMRLLCRGSGYILELDDVWLDVTEFERLVIDGLRAVRSGRINVAWRDLSDAMCLYTGDFLEGEAWDWAIEHREYLKSLALRALQALRQIAEKDDDTAELIALCRRTLDLDRHHEASYRTLIALHGRLGEHERARSWFLLCANRLNEDLGVAPEPATVAAYRLAVAQPVPAHECVPSSRERLHGDSASRGREVAICAPAPTQRSPR